MVGLLEKKQPIEQEPIEQAPTEQESGGDSQDSYERVIHAAMKIIYSDEASETLIKMLKSQSKNPGAALAMVAHQIIAQLDEKMGGAMEEDIIVPASEEILVLVMELAEAAKLFPIDENVQRQAEDELVRLLSETYGPPDEEYMASYSEDEIDQAVRPRGVVDDG
jgi:hypothetical protein